MSQIQIGRRINAGMEDRGTDLKSVPSLLCSDALFKFFRLA